MHGEKQMPGSRLVNRNVVGENGRTSMRLEPELWDALREICRREHMDIGALIRRIEAQGRQNRDADTVVCAAAGGAGAGTLGAEAKAPTVAPAVSGCLLSSISAPSLMVERLIIGCRRATCPGSL